MNLKAPKPGPSPESPEQTFGKKAKSLSTMMSGIVISPTHRLGWCRVIEKRVKARRRQLVEKTRERHKGIISSIRHQFQLLKPEDLTRVFNELGWRRIRSQCGDRLRNRSAALTATQSEGGIHQTPAPQTRRGRLVPAGSVVVNRAHHRAAILCSPTPIRDGRIIEIEKEGLVLMSEALEAVGDVYSINGFTSEGRRNVKFYVVKDFDEHYTRRGKAPHRGHYLSEQHSFGSRHSPRQPRASEKQDARTQLLIVLV